MLTLKISTEEKGRDDPRDLVIVGYLFNGSERCCQIVKKRKGPYAGKYFQCDNPLAREPNPHSIRFCSSHKVETDRNKCKNYDDCKSYAAVALKTGNVIEELFYSIEKETCVGYDHCVQCILTEVNSRSVENWDETGKRTREITDITPLSQEELLQYEKNLASTEETPSTLFISMQMYNTAKQKTVIKNILANGDVEDVEDVEDTPVQIPENANNNANDSNDEEEDEEDSEDSTERQQRDEKEHRRKKNTTENERKWQRAKQLPDNVRCKWVLKNGPRLGFRCHRKRAGAHKTGGDEYCDKCLTKHTVKVELYKDQNKISPTLTKMKQEIEETKPPNIGTIYTRKEFNIHDYALVYQKKSGMKTINRNSSPEIKALSYHWKFIIEVLTSDQELAVEMAAVLIMACDDRIKRCKEKKFWIRKSNRSCWLASDRDEVLCKLKEFKDEFIVKCLDFVVLIPMKKAREIEELSKGLKLSLSRKFEKDVMELFMQNIIDKNFVFQENPIGQKFIDDVLEFTIDRKSYHGITTTLLFKAREKWILDNPQSKLESYTLIQFGRMVTHFKLWEIDIDRSKIRRHLGIKFKL